MSLIYLIRHAAADPAPDEPASQWRLSEAGFLAAGALAGRRFWPEIDRVVTSTEHKAISTAAPAVEMWRLSSETRPAFDEVRRAGFTDAYEEAVRAFFAEPDRAPAGWESASEARARVVAGLEALLEAYPAHNLALVGHGLLWSLLRAYLLGQPRVEPGDWQAILMPDVAVWRYEAGNWSLLQDFEGIRKRGH